MRILTSPWAILTVAFALRLWSLANYTALHPHQALGTIPFLFEPGNIAYALANGQGFSSPFRVDSGPTAWMTPVYPALLAGVFRVFGNYTYAAFLAAASANIIFSALTCLPLYFAGQRLLNRAAGATAAWLWAIFPTAIILPYESFWDASAAALLMATILWATLALTRSNTIHAWYAYGLLWGLALMTSATLASLLPFLLGWAAWCARSFSRNSLEKPALAAGIAILCCVPWTVRNYAQFHTLVPLRSVMGLSLYVGNNDRADGVGTANLHPISNQAERNRYIEAGEIAYMADKRDQAVTFMASHPAKTLQLTANRFIAFWIGGTVHPFSDFLRPVSWWPRWVLFCEAFTTLGAFTGLVLLSRARRYGTIPMAAAVLVFPLPYYLTIAPARYRHPLEPVLILLTATAAILICQTRDSRSAPPNRSA